MPFVSKRTEQQVYSLLQAIENPSTPFFRKIDFLHNLWELADQDELKQPLCEEPLNLFPRLKKLLEENDSTQIRFEITGMLWYLSRDDIAAQKLGSPQSTIIPTLISLLHLRRTHTVGEGEGEGEELEIIDEESFEANILKMFGNLCLQTMNLSYLISSEFGFLDYVAELLLQIPSAQIYLYHITANLTQSMELEHLSPLLQSNLCAIVCNSLISYGVDPRRWSERVGGAPYWCLNALMNLSTLPYGYGARVIAQYPSMIEFLIEMFRKFPESFEGLKAVMIVTSVFLVDSSENIHNSIWNIEKAGGIYEEIEPCLQLLFNIFDVTVNFDPESPIVIQLTTKGFIFAIISLRVITTTIRNLFIHSQSKRILRRYLDRVVGLTVQVIRGFVNNEPSYQYMNDVSMEQAGGGGEDYVSVHQLLEFLLQVSFDVKNKQEFNNITKTSLYEIVTMLQELLDLPVTRKMTPETRSLTATLLDYLRE